MSIIELVAGVARLQGPRRPVQAEGRVCVGDHRIGHVGIAQLLAELDEAADVGPPQRTRPGLLIADVPKLNGTRLACVSMCRPSARNANLTASSRCVYVPAQRLLEMPRRVRECDPDRRVRK
jgi:hypothetical protein